MSAITLNSNWETPFLSAFTGLMENGGGETLREGVRGEVVELYEIRLSPPIAKPQPEALPTPKKQQEVAERQASTELDRKVPEKTEKKKEKKEIGGLEPYQIILAFTVSFALFITILKIFVG